MRLARTASLALIEPLRADLLTQASATLALERWCLVHRLADPPVLRAELRDDVSAAMEAPDRMRLRIEADEPVRCRHVRLRCGPLVLSEAINWYVPGRLTAAMNRQLDSTDIPFGKVVASLGFERHIVSSTLLWPPDAPMPEYLFRNRAILVRTDDGLPIAELVENYRCDLLRQGQGSALDPLGP